MKKTTLTSTHMHVTMGAEYFELYGKKKKKKVSLLLKTLTFWRRIFFPNFSTPCI